MHVSGLLHTPAALPTGPIEEEAGGSQSRSGRCGIEKNLLPLPGIEPRPSGP
jgi:hypothetical protein